MDESSGDKPANESLEKYYKDDERLPKAKMVRMDKEVFLKPRRVKIVDFYLNRWGKPTLCVVGDSKASGEITIPNSLYMELQGKYGDLKTNWKNQFITLKAERTEFTDRQGIEKSGYTLVLIE